MSMDVIMNVALTDHWENFIRHLIRTGRYNNGSEGVRAALRELRRKRGAIERRRWFGLGNAVPLRPALARGEIEACRQARQRLPRPTPANRGQDQRRAGMEVDLSQPSARRFARIGGTVRAGGIQLAK